MGMYTQLSFNAQLKKDTPSEVIGGIQWLAGIFPEGAAELGDLVDPKAKEFGWHGMFNMFSYYHVPSASNSKVWFGTITHQWHLSLLFDIKNYYGQLEKFVEWISPYIEGRGDEKTFLGYTRYEEDDEPTLLYLDRGYEEDE